MEIENTTYLSYLIEMAKAGRHRGFLELCAVNLRNVYTVVFRLTNDLPTAKKITTDTFLKLWTDIKEYPIHKPFLPWLKGKAIFLAMEALENNDQAVQTHDEESKNSNEVRQLEYYIKQLPMQNRTIFVLHDLEGYSYRELKYFFPDLIEDEIKTILIQTRQSLMLKLDK